MNKTSRFILPMLLMISVLFGKAQTTGTISARTKVVIDSTYEALIKKYNVVGMSLAIVDNGQIVYAKGYGFSDRENKVKANEKTVYRIGSCTKSFTSLSLLQLQEKNLINIKSPVKTYLPELNLTSRFNDNNQLYINDMLCHVSGMPCDILNGFFCDSPPSINWVIEELNKQTTISPMRYKHAYSNVAYGLLGEVVSRKSNTSYSNYVKENIFKPLNMTSSYIDNDPLLSKDFSVGYVNNKPIKEPLIRDQAAGLIHSNVVDMANYVLMYLGKGTCNGNKLLSPESIADMEADHLQGTILERGDHWGYGLYSSVVMAKKDKDSTKVTLVGHGGDTFAFHADFGYIPELNVGVVLLTNTDNGRSVRSAAKLLKLYVKETKGQNLRFNYKEPEAQVTSKGENTSLNERKGNYNFGNFAFKITNTSKIKFKQGPATIVMKLKSNDTNYYKVKAKLLGFVPIPIGDQQFRFVKLNGKVYAKSYDGKSKQEEFEGLKSEPKTIPDAWKKLYGDYKAVNKVYECKNCVYGDTDGMSLSLGESKGFLVIATKAKSRDMNREIYLEMVSDTMCVTGGIGRGTGETVRILENGNLYYSGFEFKKVK